MGVAILLSVSRIVVAEDEPEPPILVLDTGGFTASEINAIAISHGDDIIAVGGGKEVRLWNVETGRPVATLRGFSEPDGFNIGKVNTLAFSTDDRYLIVGVTDNSKLGSTRIYDLSDPESSLKLVPGHTGCTVGAFMARDGRKVFTYGCADKLEVFAINATEANASISEEVPIKFDSRPETKLPKLFCGYPDEDWILIRDYQRLAVLSRKAGKPVDSADAWPAKLRQLLEWESTLRPPPMASTSAFSGRPALWVDRSSKYLRGGFSNDHAVSQFWVAVWDVGENRPTTVYKEHGFTPNIIAVSPSGRLAASSDLFGEIHVWGLDNGDPVRRFGPGSAHFFGIEWNGNEEILLATTPYGQADYRYGRYGVLDHSFNVATRTGLGRSGANRPARTATRMVVDGSSVRIDTRLEDGVSWLEFTAEGSRLTIAPFEMDGDSVSCHVVMGDKLIVGMASGQLLQLVLTDSKDGKYAVRFVPVRKFRGHRASVTGVGISPDGRLASCSLDGTVRFWSLESPRNTGDIGTKMEGNRLECGVKGEPHEMIPGDTIIMFDGRSFYERRRAMAKGRYVPGQKVRVEFERDGRSMDTTIQLTWVPADDEPLATLYVHGSKAGVRDTAGEHEWVMWTPDGRYDCSPGGEGFIGWHVNAGRRNPAKYYGAGQFRSQLYTPEVVSAAIAGTAKIAKAQAAVTPVSEIGGIEAALPPEVRIITPKPGTAVTGNSIDVVVEVLASSALRERDVQVFVNGRSSSDRRIVSETPQSNGLVRTRYAFSAPLDGNSCSIRAVADNGRAESRVASLEVPRHGGGDSASAAGKRLFVLAIGISDYKRTDLRLKAAASDARAFAEEMRSLEGRLYGKVATNVLTDQDATADRIGTAMDTLVRDASGAKDVVYVFLSGHSMPFNNAFRFLCHDFDEATARATSLGVGELHDWYQRELQAEGILFADTCHAGGVTRLPGSMASPWQGSQRLIISACGPNSVSFENDQHGYFAQAILEACGQERESADLIPKDGRLSVNELIAFVKDRVNRLSGGRQHPLVYDPGVVDSAVFFAY